MVGGNFFEPPRAGGGDHLRATARKGGAKSPLASSVHQSQRVRGSSRHRRVQTQAVKRQCGHMTHDPAMATAQGARGTSQTRSSCMSVTAKNILKYHDPSCSPSSALRLATANRERQMRATGFQVARMGSRDRHAYQTVCMMVVLPLSGPLFCNTKIWTCGKYELVWLYDIKQL